jgi:hypothetical protein
LRADSHTFSLANTEAAPAARISHAATAYEISGLDKERGDKETRRII